MKIYQLRTISNSRYAHIHAQMGQDVSMGKNIKVTWDNYLAKEIRFLIFAIVLILYVYVLLL